MARQEGLPKTGGRKKGTPNKKTLGLEEALELHDLDIIATLAETLPQLAPSERAGVLISMMGYLYPKRKAVELSADNTVTLLNAKEVPKQKTREELMETINTSERHLLLISEDYFNSQTALINSPEIVNAHRRPTSI